MRLLGALFVWLLIAGFLIRVVPVLAGIGLFVGVLVGGLWLIWKGSDTFARRRASRQAHQYSARAEFARAREQMQSELVERSYLQNEQFLAGDDRGVYGAGYAAHEKYEEACRTPEREAQRAEFDAEAEARP